MQPKIRPIIHTPFRSDMIRDRPEVALADIVLALGQCHRDSIRTFVHLAENMTSIAITVDASRETGLRLTFLYPIGD